MKCPVCNVDLLIGEWESIRINYCPQCRRAWLEEGELDRMFERANRAEAAKS